MTANNKKDLHRHAIWCLIKLYWVSEERWEAWSLLAVIIALVLVMVYINVLLTNWNRAMYDSLQSKGAVTLVSFVGILWAISGPISLVLMQREWVILGYMVWFAIAYAGVGSWLIWWIGKPLVMQSFNQERFEANYRFGLIHIRDGETEEALYSLLQQELLQATIVSIAHRETVARYHQQRWHFSNRDNAIGDTVSSFRMQGL